MTREDYESAIARIEAKGYEVDTDVDVVYVERDGELIDCSTPPEDIAADVELIGTYLSEN